MLISIGNRNGIYQQCAKNLFVVHPYLGCYWKSETTGSSEQDANVNSFICLSEQSSLRKRQNWEILVYRVNFSRCLDFETFKYVLVYLFSALTLLVRRHEGRWPVKKTRC